ncbi:hypothetical protein [Methylobacterium isbiliense]|uniref:hypothetical protein n=1 Tax=Methylobacterium isbiliense TaxID=315478 RepID=UPI001EE1F3C5|nr:hypothetical protein [Methylobacterium isbiliense]MDN3625866.1 hypothetical protein [Methylobacterium isbiliense]
MLATHEALVSLDPDLLADWHISIDELIDTSVACGSFSASTSWSALARQYRLEPSGDTRWWRVMTREDVEPLSLGEINRGASDQIAFHRLIRRGRPVYVDQPEWEQARLAGQRVSWWSLWTVAELFGCASITLASSSFSSSLMGMAHQHLHGEAIRFREERVGMDQLRARPLVRLHYYTRHRGSTTWWQTHEGSRCLVQISRHLEQIAFAGYWSCNSTTQLAFLHRLRGRWCEPKLSGTNRLRDNAACAYIYSSKAQASDAPILELLGLDRAAVTRAREHEDVFQFVMRGALRDPSYDGEYDVYLYSEDQALALQRSLMASGITDRVETIAVEEAGILSVVRPEARSPSTKASRDERTVQERRADEREAERLRGKGRRASAKALRVAAGTARGPGRPKKVIAAAYGPDECQR